MFSEMAQTAQRRRPGRGRHGLGPLGGLGGLRLFVGLLGRQHPLRYDSCLFAHKLKRKFRGRGGNLLIWIKSQIYHPHNRSHVYAMPFECPPPPGRSLSLAWLHMNEIIFTDPLIIIAHTFIYERVDQT